MRQHTRALGLPDRNQNKLEPTSNFLEDFSQSDLEFGPWVDYMVREGHLSRPSGGENGALIVRDDTNGWTVTLKNVGCSTITGRQDLLERAESHFCDKFIKNAESLLARKMELDVTRLLCDGGTFCKLGLKTVFEFFGWYETPEDMTKICHEIFDAVHKACPGGGGVAQGEVRTSDGGLHPVEVENAYSLNNGGGCQQGATHECFDRDVPL